VASSPVTGAGLSFGGATDKFARLSKMRQGFILQNEKSVNFLIAAKYLLI
jgi:hypothetical protein